MRLPKIQSIKKQDASLIVNVEIRDRIKEQAKKHGVSMYSLTQNLLEASLKELEKNGKSKKTPRR